MKKILAIFFVCIIVVTSSSCSVNRPDISEEWLIGSAQVMEMNSEIEDAEVMVEEGKLSFYMVPNDEIEVPIERIRELGVDFLKIFAGYTVNEEITGPNEDSLGEIYEYYDVEIIVEGYRTILERGTKSKGNNEIVWEGQEV